MVDETVRDDGPEPRFSVTVSEPTGCKRVLSIEIPEDEVERERVRVLEGLRRDLRVPGFRRGKVPAKYVEKNYGEIARDDAVRNLLPAVYEDALVQKGITPLGEPKFENLKAEPGEGVSVEVEVEIRPQVTLRDYLGVEVRVTHKVIGEKDVAETLDRIRERRGTFAVVERPAKEGDLLLIDYAPLQESGEVDGTKMVQNYPVDIASETLLPEFRENLRGMEVRGEKDVVVDYPQDFPDKAAAGTRKTYRVTLKEVKELRLPELDDDFAKSLGEEFADLDALRAKIRSDLEQEEEQRRRHEAEEKIIDKLIASNPFDVPQTMIENYFASILEQDRKRRPQVEDEAAREREVREHFHSAALRTIKKYLILDAVKKQENITVGPQELDAKIEDLSRTGGEKAEEVRAYFRRPDRRLAIEGELLDEKAMSFLRERAVVTAA
jgi:trigger factor